jgi:hypothetical protein
LSGIPRHRVHFAADISSLTKGIRPNPIQTPFASAMPSGVRPGLRGDSRSSRSLRLRNGTSAVPSTLHAMVVRAGLRQQRCALRSGGDPQPTRRATPTKSSQVIAKPPSLRVPAHSRTGQGPLSGFRGSSFPERAIHNLIKFRHFPSSPTPPGVLGQDLHAPVVDTPGPGPVWFGVRLELPGLIHARNPPQWQA